MTKITSKTQQSATADKNRTGNACTKAAGLRTTRLRRSSRKSIEAPVLLHRATPVAEVAATKQSQLAALLLRDEGATLDQMIALTGWLPHTTRAALTGLRKKGYAIDSDKVDGLRTYRAVAPK